MSESLTPPPAEGPMTKAEVIKDLKSMSEILERPLESLLSAERWTIIEECGWEWEDLGDWIASHPLLWERIREFGMTALEDWNEEITRPSALADQSAPKAEPIGLAMFDGELFLIEQPKWRRNL